MNNNERIACLTATGARQPALQSVHASGDLRGALLRMRLRQHYRNTGDDELETVYAFPLAWGTTLLAMRVTLNGREMTGSVIEKKEAEARYEDAVEAGDLPVLLVREGKDLYSARLGNLKPGDDAIIEIECGQLVRLDRGRLRLTIPTTIAPRFGSDPGLDGLPSQALGAVDPRADYGFRLTLDVWPPFMQGRIDCPSHRVTQQRLDDRVRIELAQPASLDRDFVLSIGDLPDSPSVFASPEPGNGGGYALLSSFVPRLDAAVGRERALQLKVLVDCSGSMAGDSMRLAKQALRHAFRELRPTDTVSFSRFGSHTHHVIDRLTAANREQREKLMHSLDETEANMGGTELEAALRQVIQLGRGKESQQRGSAILLVTDGDVWDIDAIVVAVRASGHPVYALGVGSSPAESLLRELAEVSGGACELVAPNESMDAAVGRLVDKMRSSIEVEISVDIDGVVPAGAVVRRVVAPGEMVHVWSQLNHRPVQPPRIRVSDVVSGASHDLVPEAVLPETEGVVARIGAAQRLLDITDLELRTELALRYQLMTEQTNLFLVHERATLEKAGGVPALQQIGSMMSAGWGGMGTVSASFDCFSEPAFLRRETGMRFGKNPSPRALATPAVWRREASSDRKARSASDGRRVYASLAQVVAYPDEPDNPLRQLLADLEAAGGVPSALQDLLERLDADARSAWITSLLDQLSAVVGSRLSALAVVVDWAASQFTSWRVSRRGLRPVATILKTLPADLRTQALDRVALAAIGPADPLPEAPAERYDIPAFLRRSAD